MIKSKDTDVDYLQFDILNMDKLPGKLVRHGDLVYAARLEFDVNEYTIVIDKSYKYNKEMHNNLVSKTGNISPIQVGYIKKMLVRSRPRG